MDEKKLKDLQRYISKRSKGQTDGDVMVHIEKLNSKNDITEDEWEKLLFPVCANCDIAIFEYILVHLSNVCNPNEYIQHTVRFRKHMGLYEEKQVAILAKLFTYVHTDEKQQILNDALVSAVWFGEYECVKYLVQEGADLKYQSSGRSMLELAQNAIDRFSDYRVERFILDFIQNQ